MAADRTEESAKGSGEEPIPILWGTRRISASSLPPYTTDEAVALGLCGICTIRPATETCPPYTFDARQMGLGALCRHCHASKRLAYPCKCLSLDEAVKINAEEEEMAARKKTTNGGSNGDAEVPKGVPKGAVARDRYEERLPCKSDDTVAAVKARELAKLAHQRTSFLERRKAENAKAREVRAYFDERIEELAAEVDGQVEYRNVEVQEYLLPTNEVIAVRRDTGEIIETRPADAEDLQDRIPGSEGKPKPKPKRAKKDEGDGAEDAAV
jgi:hypothetical protein